MSDAAALADPYLRNWLAGARSVTSEAGKLFDELTAEQLTWKPAPKVWSVAECFSHLAAAAALYHPRVESALVELRSGGAPAASPFKARWLQRWFIEAVGPQAKRRMKTHKMFAPASAEIDVARLERDFLGRQEELAALIRRADGLDLNRGTVVSPVTKLLRFTLGEAFWMLTAHAERHMLQAGRLPREPGFPVA